MQCPLSEISIEENLFTKGIAYLQVLQDILDCNVPKQPHVFCDMFLKYSYHVQIVNHNDME